MSETTNPREPSAELAPNGWPRSLLEGFRAGDPGALTRVYELHAREVAQVLRRGFSFESGGERRRFVGHASSHDLQDALHETFRRAFEPRARDGYDGLRPYGPYLIRIAQNVVLRSFRARERAFPLEGEVAARTGTAVPLAGGPPEDPDQAVAREQIRALVAAYLAGLDAMDREVVRLRFVEGKPQREAAALLGLGRQRLRTRERNIRRGLLAHLRRHGEDALSLAAWPVVLGMLVEVLR